MKVKMINNNNNNNNDNNNLFQCLGICQRLFNFIVNNLVFYGLKRVATTCHPMRQGPTSVPIISTAKPKNNQIEYHKAQFEAHYDNSAQTEARIRERKGKNVVAFEATRENVKLQKCPSPQPPARQRQVRPLFDVAVNINEKSDAFIRSRKEAMRRNYYC